LISSTALTLILLPTYYRLGEIVDLWARRRFRAVAGWRPSLRRLVTTLRRRRAEQW
jgi:hypothetical protein